MATANAKITIDYVNDQGAQSVTLYGAEGDDGRLLCQKIDVLEVDTVWYGLVEHAN